MKKVLSILGYLFAIGTIITIIESCIEKKVIEGLPYYIIISVICFISSKLIKEKKDVEEVTEVLDENWKKLSNKFYINEKEEQIKLNEEIISFKEIIDVELEENIEHIEKTVGDNISKGRAGMGIITPVYRGKTKINTTTTTEGICNFLRIKIKLNNITNPLIVYNFINAKTNIDENYNQKKIEAEKCTLVIENIIKKLSTQ